MTLSAQAQIVGIAVAVLATVSAFADTGVLDASACASKAEAAERLLCFDEAAMQSKHCSNQSNARQRLQCYDRQALDLGWVEATPADQELTTVQQRFVDQARAEASDSPWMIIPHRQTYILPYSYLISGLNVDPYVEAVGSDADPQQGKDYEAKYQISFAVPLWRDMFGGHSELLFGYTQISVWQFYSSEISAPFRDTNYEPELIWRTPVGARWGGLSFDGLQVALNHQSNGRTEPLSKSWNRIIASMAFSTENWVFALRPWYRIPEDAEEDNNPDIDDYLGYGEFWSWYKIADHTLGLMLRNNLRSDGNKTTGQLDWSFPLGAKLKGYVQYFNGYGETLVDYQSKNERLGVGVMLVNTF